MPRATTVSTFTVVFAMVMLAGCAEKPAPQPEAQQVQGGCADVFGGNVCTWGTILADKVTEFGATIPMATIEAAPLEAEMVWPPKPEALIPLPEPVSQATGFKYLSVYWEAHGHPPALFMTPHFDFHFYTTDQASVATIDCSNQTKPAALAPGYALPDIEIPGLGTLVGICVPGMGMHAMPEAEINVQTPFGASMLFGYYDQNLIFVEPMIARAKLLEAKTFAMDIPTLSGHTLPARAEIAYDSTASAYRMSFAVPSAQ